MMTLLFIYILIKLLKDTVFFFLHFCDNFYYVLLTSE